jgi:hypothetical protein
MHRIIIGSCSFAQNNHCRRDSAFKLAESLTYRTMFSLRTYQYSRTVYAMYDEVLRRHQLRGLPLVPKLARPRIPSDISPANHHRPFVSG